MAWILNSSNGTLSKDGELITDLGWSGHDAGRDNPAMEQVHDIGPIPRGEWDIGDSVDSEKLGPVVMPLIPREGTVTYGRGGFFIHGASAVHPGESSHGCVILPRSVRMQIAASEDKTLQVV